MKLYTQIIKRVITILLAIAAVVSLCIPAYAQTVDFGEFTVEISGAYQAVKENIPEYGVYRNASGSAEITIRKYGKTGSLNDLVESTIPYLCYSPADQEKVIKEESTANGTKIASLSIPGIFGTDHAALFLAGKTGYLVLFENRDTAASTEAGSWKEIQKSITVNTAAFLQDAGKYETLQKGANGNSVKELQNRLIELHYLRNGDADGDFGDKTKQAIERFQKSAELSVTGIADGETQAMLFSDLAPEARMSVSCSSIVIGSYGTTSWYVDGQEFTLQGAETRILNTPWGTYRFDALGNYEEVK